MVSSSGVAITVCVEWVYGFGGLERWNGMAEWTGLDWTGIQFLIQKWWLDILPPPPPQIKGHNIIMNFLYRVHTVFLLNFVQF